MISLVLPYWMRQKATDKSLALMAQHYAGLDLEVVIVDDGDPTPFVAPDVPLNIKVVRLPTKTDPKDPCVPINAGVKAASGEVIALSNPEILHEKPVLPQMLDELRRLGPKGYVLAACWCPDDSRWHCHSSLAGRPVKGIKMPKWANYNFMAMLYRDFYWQAGGLDEDYRDGFAYDDPDFVLRLDRAGAVVSMRDDLVVTHSRVGAKTVAPLSMYERNKKLFIKKWKQP